MGKTTSRSKRESKAGAPAPALALAARGWQVFPCEGKRPRTAHGLHDATSDPATLERWWGRAWPGANIAVRTGAESGVIVLDVDGDDGADTLHGLEREHDELPPTVECLTGEGRHLYFRHPGFEVRNSAGKLGVGVDARGDGGYVIAPPSVHENGRHYEWGADRSPADVAVAELPSWLAELLLHPPASRNGNAPDAPVVEGSRNTHLASLAGSMRRKGMSAESIAAALRVENAQRCQPPLPEAEVERIAASIARYEPAESADTAGGAYELTWDDKGALKLPPTPELGDVAGHCAWLTCVFALDAKRPITSGHRQGVLGPEGHVELRRAGALPIRFEPITRINAPNKLIEVLSSRMIPSDGMVPPLKAVHCQQIAYVIRMLCGAQETLTDAQETAGIIGTFMQGAVLADAPVTTYGTSAQRYETALSLRRSIDEVSGRPIGPPRYALDHNTGEMVIAVSDLAEAARRHTGSSLPRGWLDARMSALGWERITLQGYALPGRDGRAKGPHARINAYRGMLASDEAVNT